MAAPVILQRGIDHRIGDGFEPRDRWIIFPRFAPPDVDKAVLFADGITAQDQSLGRIGFFTICRDQFTGSGGVVFEAVEWILDAVTGQLADGRAFEAESLQTGSWAGLLAPWGRHFLSERSRITAAA